LEHGCLETLENREFETPTLFSLGREPSAEGMSAT
jgi:hypothetical protein